MTNNNEIPDSSQEGQDLVLDDDSLEAASGGQNTNSTLIVYASTFVPFDSSF
jgi:hypothetical protein